MNTDYSTAAKNIAEALEYDKYLIHDVWLEYVHARRALDRQFDKLPHLESVESLTGFALSLGMRQVDAERAAVKWDAAASGLAKLKMKFQASDEDFKGALVLMFNEVKAWSVGSVGDYARRETPAVKRVAEAVAYQNEVIRRGHEMIPELMRPQA